MSEFIDILTLAAGADRVEAEVAIAEAARRAGAAQIFLEPSLPNGRFAGDLLLRLKFDGAAVEPVLPPTVTRRDGAIYDAAWRGGTSPAAGIFRTALFAAINRPTSDRLAAFEKETAAMPRYIAAIRGWSLGRVSRAWGRFPWTYVWEQTFDTLEDLTRSYMLHPIHWGHVDRWFDTETPELLIDPGVCHAFARSAALPSL